MESIERPYGDEEHDYRTVDPEGEELDDDAQQRLEPPTVDDDPHHGDPAFAPVYEAGGGVSEGFETAEGQLVENIENAPYADRTVDGFDLDDPGTDVDEDVAGEVEESLEEPLDAYAVTGDEQARRTTAAYAEPDQVDVTEVTRDPAEGDDDPGRGPGISFDR